MEFKEKMNELYNPHGLKVKDIEKAKVLKPKALTKKPFERNENIKAYCLSGSVGKGSYGNDSDSDFFIAFYDNGNIKIKISCMEGMCSYNIEDFFNEKDIENGYDLEIQILLLKRLNWLIKHNIVEI